ncbi:MAG: RagB/SusD family nutrient uptake outer membrane protein, partial [Mangrovibacterium sp.]|nr:RagB/SusD family nutrient uptake outer membrane protein [Mangrovibacterium sp.]
MKQIYALVILLLIGIGNGCNDDFMDRFPPDKLNDGNFWSSENDLILYCNRLYPEYLMSSFNGKGNPVYSENIVADYVVTNPFQKIPAGIHTIPTNAGDGGWNWVNMRRINYFLARYQKTPVSQEIKNVYAGEILFFKAWDYFDKIKRFGEVPWISSDLRTDSEELMAPRTSRAALLDSVLATIDKAILYLPEKGKEKTDRINKDMALHLKARMCLFEGTFRKYHTELGLDGNKFLENAADASGRL